MRKPPLSATTEQQVVPCVLLVGVDSEHEALCRQCATHAAGARLVTCDVASVTTRAAELRPLALVVPSDILDFDPEEFRALARTVNAALVPLRTDLPAEQIGEDLLGGLFEAAGRRR